MSDKAKNLVRAWQQLRKNRGIIALPEPGWEDWQAVDEAIAVECTVPAPQPTARTAEEKAAKLEELRQSYDCGNMGWSEAVGLYCAWQIAAHCPEKELGHGTEQPPADIEAAIERAVRRLAGNLTICSQFYSEAWRTAKIREVLKSELVAPLKSGKYPIARPSSDLLHTIRYLLLSWSVFYTKLPDGDYDGLGEMRTAMANLSAKSAEKGGAN